MKRITFYAAMLTMVLLSACSTFTAPEINSEETVGKLKEIVKENVTDKGMRVIELTIMPKEALANNPDLITLLVADKDNKFHTITLLRKDLSNSYEVRGDEPEESYRGHSDAQGIQGIDVANMPLDVIVKQVEEAKTHIPEGYDFEGVNNYRIMHVDGKPHTSFYLQVTESGKSTKVTGRRIETTYYELDCEVDENGQVKAELE